MPFSILQSVVLCADAALWNILFLGLLDRDSMLGMIQKLRNAVVAPTGMGKNYGRIMPLLRQGWLVRQKIMHYGFLDNASQDAFAAKRKHPNCSQYYFFGRFPWAL